MRSRSAAVVGLMTAVMVTLCSGVALAVWSSTSSTSISSPTDALSTPTLAAVSGLTSSGATINWSDPGSWQSAATYTATATATNHTTRSCNALAGALSCGLTGLDAGITYSVSVAGQLNNWVSAAATTTATPTAAVASFTVTPSSTTQTAGTAFNVTITAKLNGVTDTTYSGAKTLDWTGGLTSPSATAPIYPTNPVSFASGAATVSVTLFAAGSTAQTLSVVDHNNSGYTGATSPGITVNSAGVQLSFNPGSTQVTKNTTTTFTVVVPNDAYGNAFVSTTGLPVSLTITNTSNWGLGSSTGTGTRSLTITSGPSGNTFSVTESGANKSATLSATTTGAGFTAPTNVSLTSTN